MMMPRRNTGNKLGCCLLLKDLVAPFHTIKAGVDPNEYARKMYEEMLQSRRLPPLERFNHLLGRFVEFELYPAAISLNRQMVMHGIARDAYTLSTLVSSYCHLNQLGFGLSVMGNIIKMGHQADAIAFDSLIHGFVRENKVIKAAEIFSKLLRQGNCKPSYDTFSAVLDGFESIKDLEGINIPTMYPWYDAIFAYLEAQASLQSSSDSKKYIARSPANEDSFDEHLSLQAHKSLPELLRGIAATIPRGPSLQKRCSTLQR